MTLRQNESASRWLMGLLVAPRLRRYRLSGGCLISLRVGSHFVSRSRLTRHLPPSIMHLLSRCNNSLRDNRFCLVRGRGTSLVLVSSVARKVTMPKSALRISLPSLLSLQPTLIWSRGLSSGRRCL